MRRPLPLLIVFSCAIIITLTKCGKTLNDSAANNSARRVQPELLPGSCPYPCTDTRCQAYANGYCGTGTSTDTVAPVKNTANPQDSIGARHNAALDAILPIYLAGTQPSQSNEWSNSISYLSSHGYSSVFLTVVEDTVVNELGPDSLSVTATGNYWYSRGTISQRLKNYITNLGTIVSSFSSTPTASTYSSFASSVKTLETTILADSLLSGTEKANILSATSVARYSGEYWTNYYNQNTAVATSTPRGTKTTTGYGVVAPNQAQGGGSWFNSTAVVGADVTGVISGAVGGAVASTISAGAATVPAVIAGAAAGGVSNSVKKAAEQIWNHFFGS